MNHYYCFLYGVKNCERESSDESAPKPFVLYSIKFWAFQNAIYSCLYTIQKLKSQPLPLTFVPTHGDIDVSFSLPGIVQNHLYLVLRVS